MTSNEITADIMWHADRAKDLARELPNVGNDTAAEIVADIITHGEWIVRLAKEY